jgi:hypothetical protein
MKKKAGPSKVVRTSEAANSASSRKPARLQSSASRFQHGPVTPAGGVGNFDGPEHDFDLGMIEHAVGQKFWLFDRFEFFGQRRREDAMAVPGRPDAPFLLDP